MPETEYDYWRIQGYFKGDTYIPRHNSNLPAREGYVAITKYCKFIQNPHYPFEPAILEIKIKIEKDVDHVRVAYDFCEKLLTEFLLALNISCKFNFIGMKKATPKQEEEKDFVHVHYEYDDVEKKWEPYIHYSKGLHLVTYEGGIRSARPLNGNAIKTINDHLGILDNTDILTLEAIEYYKRGMKLFMDRWKNESFLSFYKVIELFRDKEYKNLVKEKISKTKMLRYICETTNFRKEYEGRQPQLISILQEISGKLTKVRNMVAHAYVDVEVTDTELRVCKDLAKHLINIHLHHYPSSYRS